MAAPNPSRPSPSAVRYTYTDMISERPSGPPAVIRKGVKSLNVHRLTSSRLVSRWPLMRGNTASRSVCHVDAPASRAVSRCDGGTFPRAAPQSIIENAVPRHTLNTTTHAIGWSSSHAVPGVPSMALRVPPSRSRSAIHRNAMTEDGRIQASSTSPSTRRLTRPDRSRITHAIEKPSTVCPITADPRTNWSVSHSDRWKSPSPSTVR